jgi:hypothetical protein
MTQNVDDGHPALAPGPPKRPRRPLPEEMARDAITHMARDAITHEESAPGDKVHMTFRVVLRRSDAEALAARAIREEKNIGMVVTGILEGAARRGGSHERN